MNAGHKEDGNAGIVGLGDDQMTTPSLVLRWPSAARACAGGIALAALAGEVLFFLDNRAAAGGALAALWAMAAYLTDWSNTAVAVVFGALALNVRWFERPATIGAPVVIILSVGIGYAALGGWQGLTQKPATDVLTHVVTPWLSLAFWLAFVRPGGIGWTGVATWLILPAAYFGYAIIRSSATGAWPYPFMDPGEVGWGGTIGFCAGMLMLAALIGLALAGLDRLRRPKTR